MYVYKSEAEKQNDKLETKERITELQNSPVKYLPELMQSLLDDFTKLYLEYNKSTEKNEYNNGIQKKFKLKDSNGAERLIKFSIFMRKKDQYNDERPIYSVDINKKNAYEYCYGSLEASCTNLQYINNEIIIKYTDNVWYHDAMGIRGSEGITHELEEDLIVNEQYITRNIKQLYEQAKADLISEWDKEKESDQEKE